jgi:hypothetical protein
MLTSKDLQVGQSISADISFRCGPYGGDNDYAHITGTVIRKLDCYNQILVDVDIKNSFNPPQKQMWLTLNENAEVTINN